MYKKIDELNKALETQFEKIGDVDKAFEKKIGDVNKAFEKMAEFERIVKESKDQSTTVDPYLQYCS